MTRALILHTDLEAVTREDDSVLFTERTLDQYLEAQHLVLKQVSNKKTATKNSNKKQQQNTATKTMQQHKNSQKTATKTATQNSRKTSNLMLFYSF